MKFTEIIQTNLKEIEAFRALFLHENNFQFVHNKCHLYGWADTYLFKCDEKPVGYGSVWGKDKREDRDTIFEFFVLPGYRKLNNNLFRKLIDLSGVSFLECQTNDKLLSTIFFEHAQNITAEAILFKDEFQTNFKAQNVAFKKLTPEAGARKDDLKYVLKSGNETIAAGGLMLNYNFPYTDIYYEVNEQYRRQGYGTFMLQELKKAAYNEGRVPAARCNINNNISKTALLKAGFKICGYLLNGEVRKQL